MKPAMPGWVVGLVIACFLFAMASMTYIIIANPKDACPAKLQTAAISQRAAQICSTELVGCSLTFEQVKQVLAEQEAAKGCQ